MSKVTKDPSGLLDRIELKKLSVRNDSKLPSRLKNSKFLAAVTTELKIPEYIEGTWTVLTSKSSQSS